MEPKLSNIKCFMISLLSISLLASSINGRIILDYKHGRELKEQSTPHSIKDDDIVFQGNSSFISHSNPWANYWIYDAANNAENEDEDLVKSKLEAIKSLINKEGMSFNGHLNPWANYWIYDNANKKLIKDEDNMKNEEELNELKIEAFKNILQNKDNSFVGHSNPWANYWIYDNANKKSTNDQNKLKIEEDLYESKINALRNDLQKDKSFVGHTNPWANFWIYDSANKKSTNDENDVKNEEELKELKVESLKNILQKKDKSFVGHSNPWANYWIYDSANKKSTNDQNKVEIEEEGLKEQKIEALKYLMKKEDKSFVGHLNPWANYWIYDNANKKLNKDENNVKNEEENVNNKKLNKDENNVKNDEEDNLNESKIEALKNVLQKEDESFVGHTNPWANYWIYDRAIDKSSKDENNVKNQEDLNESKIDATKDLKNEDNSKDSNVVLKQSA
ncbi:uncharacterized protein LOC141622398 [Silene latifolia]|uniref:uncharacterized protein LOC141622398 n=1 Tax=Silene latifolia TaxID=37657 RepID=UPI003D779555